MKKIKRNSGRDEEKWIGELLDRVDEEKLLEISAIHSDVPLPVPNQEKLAQSVIDRADLADEEELARRRAFAKAYRRKKILHGCIAACAVLAIFAVLALLGVFDNIYLPKYKYTIEAATVYNGAEADVKPQFKGRSIVSDPGCGIEQADFVSSDDSVSVNKDKLDNTAYDAVAKYCKKNHYAVDEHKVLRYWQYKDGDKSYIMCEVAATFMNLDKSPDGIGIDEASDTYVRSGGNGEAYLLTIDLNRVMSENTLDSTQGVVVFLLTLEV